jgi:hypothetical protein
MEDEDKRLKMAVIAGASKALELKSTKRKYTEQDIMQEITDSAEKIISRIDQEL